MGKIIDRVRDRQKRELQRQWREAQEEDWIRQGEEIIRRIDRSIALMQSKRPEPWKCQKCDAPIGHLGRFLRGLMGGRLYGKMVGCRHCLTTLDSRQMAVDNGREA